VAKAVLNYMPTPNLSGGGTNNYVLDSHDTLAQTVYSFRIDQNIGANHKVWGFFSSRENTDQGNGLNLPAPPYSGGGARQTSSANSSAWVGIGLPDQHLSTR